MGKHRLLLMLSFGLFVLIGIVMYVQPTHATAKPIAKVLLEPTRQSVTAGGVYELVIQEDSYDQAVNAAQINLSYPQDMLTFQAIDASKSAFDIEAQGEDIQGTIKIARAVIKPITGKHEVARVTFITKKTITSNPVTLAQDSAVVRSSDTVNLLATDVVAAQPVTGTPDKASLWTTITGFFKKLFSFGAK